MAVSAASGRPAPGAKAMPIAAAISAIVATRPGWLRGARVLLELLGLLGLLGWLGLHILTSSRRRAHARRQADRS